MKKLVICMLVLLPMLFNVSYGFGLGVMIGEPTGLSAKFWKNERTAIGAGLAWSFANRNSAIQLHVDYLIHNYNLLRLDNTVLPLYYGLGVRVGSAGDDIRLGVRVPVGIDYFFADKKFDVFFEIVPVLDLLPGTGFGINGGLGLRYNF